MPGRARKVEARARQGVTACLGLAALLASAACSEYAPAPDGPGERPRRPAATSPASPYLRILGTAQDGGLPHAACDGPHCRLAREEPGSRRLVASVAIVDPTGTPPKVYLVDATPDVREQLDLLRDVRMPPRTGVDRDPIDGVFLTHAHIGHYLGLAFFGFEAIHSRDLPIWTSPAMAAFLRDNGPWNQLVELGNVELHETRPGEAVALGEKLAISTLPVPHRDEYADTVAFVVSGPDRTALYVPDTDRWEAWQPSLLEAIDRLAIDVALVDATFFSTDELPGRSVEEIGHPLVTVSMDLLQAAVDSGRLEVWFTHLNHSNPAVDPNSDAAREIRRRGFAVAREGLEIPL